MFVIIEKTTGKFIRDTGTNSNIDVDGLYNNISKTIDESTQEIIYIKDGALFVKIFNILSDEGENFKVELDKGSVVGIRII